MSNSLDTTRNKSKQSTTASNTRTATQFSFANNDNNNNIAEHNLETVGRVRSESPIIGECGEVTIPGEQEFNQLYDSVRKQSLQSDGKKEVSSFVKAFSKTEATENHFTFEIKTNMSNHIELDNENEIRNTPSGRNTISILPDYVSRFAKVDSQPINATVEVVGPPKKIAVVEEVSKNDSGRGIGRRRRVRGSTTPKRTPVSTQGNKEHSSEDSVRSSVAKPVNSSVPSYIKPVIKPNNVETLNYRMPRDNQVPAIPNRRHAKRGFVKRQVARRGENRLSSSTSGDSSSNESQQNQIKTKSIQVPLTNTKTISYSSENEQHSSPNLGDRKTRRQRHRNRTTPQQQHRFTHTPDYIMANQSRKVSGPIQASALVQAFERDFSAESANKIRENSLLNQPELVNHTSCDRKSKGKQVNVVDSKYNTLPENFRSSNQSHVPPISANIQGTVAKTPLIVSPQNKIRSNSHSDSGEIRNELMISSKQTSTPSEETETKKQSEQNINANQLQEKKHSRSNSLSQTSTISSNARIDRCHSASGRKGSLTEKSPLLVPQFKSKPVAVDNLRIIFSAQEDPKREFGQVFTKTKKSSIEQTEQQKQNAETAKTKTISTQIKKSAVYGNDIVEQVIASNTKLTAIKVSEDFWPRDKATAQLLSRNSSGSFQTDNSPTEQYDEQASMPANTITDEMNNEQELLKRLGHKTDNNVTPISTDGINNNNHSVTNTYTPNQLPGKTQWDKQNETSEIETNVISPNQFGDSSVANSGLPKNEKLKNQWSFQDTDAKLKDFDSQINENVELFTNSNADIFKVAESDLNELTNSLHDIEINGSPLYTRLNFNLDSQQTDKGPSLGPKSPKGVIHPVNLQPLKTSTSTGNNKTSTISTSSRKSSIVSQSTALPRKPSVSQSDIVSEVADIDEGCFTEEDVLPKPYTVEMEYSLTGKMDNDMAAANSRRRRKYSAAPGQSDSSNTGTDSSRSLSDPILRNKSLSNELSGSIDSNLLGALQTRSEEFEDESAQMDNSVSDLSMYSEGASIQGDFHDNNSNLGDTNIMDKVVAGDSDGKFSSKLPKKKSFSDPNANAVITAGLMDKGMLDLDSTTLYNSSSEPTLIEQCDELGELNQFRNYQSARISDSYKQKDIKANVPSSIDDMKSMLMSAAVKKKAPEQNDNANAQNAPDNTFESEEQRFRQIYESMKMPISHTRSNSAPSKNSPSDQQLINEAVQRERRSGIVQAPSLLDVMIGSRKSDSTNMTSLKKMSNSVDRIHSATLPRAAGSRELDYKTFMSEKDDLDLRKHVVKNLLETEESYVNSLHSLYETYFKPLKLPENHGICEPRLVDEMFFQIPEILQHHQKFFQNIQDCFENWDSNYVKIGDVFMQSFNKDKLLESYTSYIKNYLNAREAVTIAIQAKVAFKLFLEQCQRENRDKQGLSDLMIKPVQRIPRYELIIKDLLKHTPEDHPDCEGLLIAQREIHALSVQMNKGEKEADAVERHTRLLQDIEQIIEGCIEIGGVPKRRFIRQDICIELKSGNKKDRSLWLFNDILMCTTVKKGRMGSLRRSSMNLWSMTSDRVVVDFTSKYKFLWKFPLEDVELKSSSGINRQKQIQQLQNDQNTILQIEKLAVDLGCNHSLLDEAVKDLLMQTKQKLTEKQQTPFHGLMLPGRLEIGISTPEGMKMFQFEFSSEDFKAQFELLFSNAKKNFTSQKGRWDPSFMKAIPISKTRNGMQFSCSTSNINTSPGTKEVWVCNTDGYVGQVCILTLDPEPVQSQCITVCSSKICCITQVPTWDHKYIPREKMVNMFSDAPISRLSENVRKSSTNSNPAHRIIPFDDPDDSDEDNTSPSSTISSYSPYRSPYSTNNSTYNYGENELSSIKENTWGIGSDEEIYVPVMSPLMPSPFLNRRFGFQNSTSNNGGSSDSLSDISNSTGGDGSFIGEHPTSVPANTFMQALIGSGAWKKDSDGSTLHGSLEDLLAIGSGDAKRTSAPANSGGVGIKVDTEEPKLSNHAGSKMLANNGSMWLGTEDGKVMVYSTIDSIRGSKHCVQLNHAASIQCIVHHNGQAFVALSNSNLVIYSRDRETGHWDFDNKKTISLATGNSPHPISRMVVVADKELWCGCQNQIIILDLKTHLRTSSFFASQDAKRQVYCMVCSGFGVWIALDRRAQIKLYHSVSHDLLTDIDVSHSVSKMLASSDAIIRQHKAACLRITSLLVCKELLWVGTSAGVVLSMGIQNITANTTSLPLPMMPQGLAYGHTGHVRFLTSVEIIEKETAPSRVRRSSSAKRRASSNSSSITPQRTTTMVISGGDGYEDFRMNSASDIAGREDSTNHLLVWRV